MLQLANDIQLHVFLNSMNMVPKKKKNLLQTNKIDFWSSQMSKIGISLKWH